MIPAELYGPAGAIAALVVVVLAMIRGDIVPGYVYRSEREQRMKAEHQAEENTKAISTLAAHVMSTVLGKDARA